MKVRCFGCDASIEAQGADQIVDAFVAHGRETFDVGAVRPKRGFEHRPIRLVDLARLEPLSRRTQLGARRDHSDARPARADDVGDAGGGQRSDLRSSETRSCLEHDVAFARVAASRPNVVTLANGIGNVDAVVC